MTDQDIAPLTTAPVRPPADEDLSAAVTQVAARSLEVCGGGAGRLHVSPPDPHHGWGVTLEPRRPDAARVHVDAVDGELVLTVGQAWTVLDSRDPDTLLPHLAAVLDAVLAGRAAEATTGTPQARVTTASGVVRLGSGWLPWRLRRRRTWAAYAPV